MYGLPFIKAPSSGLTEAANLYQDFVVFGNRLFDVLDVNDLRRGSVPAADSGFHVGVPAGSFRRRETGSRASVLGMCFTRSRFCQSPIR
jgi:hypothetical protein